MRVICFGDSNTYGYDPRGFGGGRYAAGDRWPDLLAKETGLEVVNWGVNGAEIPSPSQPVPEPDHPGASDILLVMLGTNDLLQGASAKMAAAKMEAFLLRILPQWANILLIALPPMKRGAWVPSDTLVSESHRLVEEYGLIARNLNISYIDTRRWNIALAFDGVHFTEAGHHSFASCLAEYFQ